MKNNEKHVNDHSATRTQNKVRIITTTTYPYHLSTFNLACSLRSANIDERFVFSLDKIFSKSHGLHSALLNIPENISSTVHRYGTIDFKKTVAKNFMAVLEVLKEKEDVIVLDSDIYIYRNGNFLEKIFSAANSDSPVPGQPQPRVVAQRSHVLANSGIFYVRYSKQSIEVFEELISISSQDIIHDDQLN